MESIGSYLKQEREARQVSLEELSQTTRIPLKQLRRIEAGRFEELPGEVFTRGFIRSYASTLGLDAERLLRRVGGPPVASAPAPITAIAAPERGRRFGFALALVILVILFTLAFSVVLRPRHRDVPIELSRLSSESAACPAEPDSPMPCSSSRSTTGTPIASRLF